MRSNALAGQTLLGMPEEWAKGFQVPGRSPFSHVAAEPEDLKEYRAWVTTWWVCQMLVTGLLLVALVGCGSGRSAERDNPIPSIEVR